VHGSLDRAKDVSSAVWSAFRAFCTSSAWAFYRRTPTTFPSSFFQRTPVVAGATACMGRAPMRTVGPTKTHDLPSTREGCRCPVDQGAFHRCVRGYVKGLLLPLPAPASRSRRPHVLPMAGDNVLIGHCKHCSRASPRTACRFLRCDLERAGSPLQPRVVRSSELSTLASPRLGLTTQARQRGSVCVAFRAS
jgi:hypothetical protein